MFTTHQTRSWSTRMRFFHSWAAFNLYLLPRVMGAALPKPVLSTVLERHGSKSFRVGLAEMNGWRSSMEDAHIIHIEDEWGYFGILDGHGGEVSCLCVWWCSQQHSGYRFSKGKNSMYGPETVTVMYAVMLLAHGLTDSRKKARKGRGGEAHRAKTAALH